MSSWRIRYPGYLVGHWKLQSNALDDSGHGYDGTVSGMVYADGPFGKMVGEFDGNDDYVNMGDVDELNSVIEFTYSVWFAQDVLDVEDHLMRKYGGPSSEMSIKTLADGNLSVTLDRGANECGYFDYSVVVSAGAAHHLSVVYNGGGAANIDRLKIYVDAKPMTLTYSGTIGTRSPGTSGGNAYMGYNSVSFDGKMWDTYIHNIALTGDEIFSLYRMTKL